MHYARIGMCYMGVYVIWLYNVITLWGVMEEEYKGLIKKELK